MNKTLVALLTGIVFLFDSQGNNVVSRHFSFLDIEREYVFEEADFSRNNEFQQPTNPTGLNITGSWKFEKAEYLERPSAERPYQLKQVIDKEEDLYAFQPHFNNLVKGAIFEQEVAVVYGLFDRYSGRYHAAPTEKTNQWEMIVGSTEEIGLQTQDLLHTFNAPGLRYLVEVIDDTTIGVTLEQMFPEGSVWKFGAVRCVLKKI